MFSNKGRRPSLMDMALQGDEQLQRPDQLKLLSIDMLRSGPWQIRSHIDEDKLNELAQTLRSQGIIEPLIVRAEVDHYLIIAGERRWRAAQLAGLNTVPCIVKKNISNDDAGLWNLLENLQREDLNPVDEGRGYRIALEHYNLTQQELSESLGIPVDRMTRMRHLLELDDSVLELVANRTLSPSHALILRDLSAVLQFEMAKRAVENDWSVQTLKAQVQRLKQQPGRRRRSSQLVDPAIRELTDRLQKHLGTPVQVKTNAVDPARGELRISYHSLDELDGLLEKIGLPKDELD